MVSRIMSQPYEEELRTVAGSYHVLGLSVIPFKLVKKDGGEYEKKILVAGWKNWETQPQTTEEFLNLDWSGANAFAVILGTQATNGLYLSVVDYDCKGSDVSDEVKKKGRIILKDFPITSMEQTVNNGRHLIYWSRTKSKTIGTYHDTASLELLGDKKLCLMAPSLGYSKLNDNRPTEIENIEQTFLSVIKKHGLIKKQQPQQSFSSKKSAFNRPRPCIVEALKHQLTGSAGHLMRLAIATEYKSLDYTNEEILELFRGQTDFDVNTCLAQIESIDATKTAKCTSIKENGFCLPTCTIGFESQKKEYHSRNKTEDKSKPIPNLGFATSDIIFEQICNKENGNHYLIWDRIERKLVESFDVWRICNIGTNEYCPLPRLTWPSVTACKKYGSEEALYIEIKTFFIEHLDISDELYYDVYACFVLATWRAEDFKTAPYLFFIGPMGSGKTRGLECFQHLCYRPIIASSISASALFRVLDAWHPTLLLDEAEIYNKESKDEILSLLNSGYKRGQYALRVKGVEQGLPEVDAFDVFGFKALAGTQELAETLQSRCIITAMSKAVRHFNMFIDEAKAQELRNKLLTYRFLNLGTGNNDVVDVFLQENQGFRNPRLIELFISLIQVAPTQEIKQNLLKLMVQVTQSRLDAEQTSVEARIFEAFLKCSEKVNCGKIGTQVITDVFNDGLSEKDQVSVRFVGRRVAALGFEKCRVGTKGQSGFYYDMVKVNRLKARYFPNGLQITSENTDVSVNMGQGLVNYVNAEVSEVYAKVNQAEKPQEHTFLPLKAKVTEQTEGTEHKTQVPSQVYPKMGDGINYAQLSCYLCNKGIMDNDWVQNSFTENKPAHKKCFDEINSQLKTPLEPFGSQQHNCVPVQRKISGDQQPQTVDNLSDNEQSINWVDIKRLVENPETPVSLRNYWLARLKAEDKS